MKTIIQYLLCCLLLSSCGLFTKKTAGQSGEVVRVSPSVEEPGDSVGIVWRLTDIPIDAFESRNSGNQYTNTYGREVFQKVRDAGDESASVWYHNNSGDLQGVRNFKVSRFLDGKKKIEFTLAFQSYQNFYTLRIDNLSIEESKPKRKRSDKDVDLLIYVDLQVPNPNSSEYLDVLRHTFKLKGVKVPSKLDFSEDKDHLQSPPISFPYGFVAVMPYNLTVYVVEFADMPQSAE